VAAHQAVLIGNESSQSYWWQSRTVERLCVSLGTRCVHDLLLLQRIVTSNYA
jgi:hypothetical protein